MHKKCEHCGNNPVPHRMYWYMESLNIFLTPLRQKLLYNPVTFWLKKRNVDGLLGGFFLHLGLIFKILQWRSDAKQCKVRRAQVLWEEADKRNIEMKELLFFGKPIDVYEAELTNPSSLIFNPLPNQSASNTLRIKDKRLKIIFSGLPRPAGYMNPWLDLMDDKWLFKKRMLKNGLPVPMGGSCWKFGQAKEIFNRIQAASYQLPATSYAVIVKPRSGSRGRHSTTFVSSVEDLKEAFKIAKQLCFWVIVEEQLQGPVYRATVVNFELCGVLRGDPPFVAGDGQHGIGELITIKNNNPHPGVKDIIVDSSMELFLSRQGLILSSVISAGQTVNLSEKIGVNYGGSSSEDYEVCHPDNKDLFVRAAKLLNDPIVGFDFIIPDIAKSWKEQKCGFIEVNSLPFINLHHDPLKGQPRNVATKVWDMVGF